jgi:hypothetical protein
MAKCKECGQEPKRSLPQNNRLHLLFTEIAANVPAADGLYHNHHWWKVMFKDRWLGYNEYRTSSGKVITELKSTADCNVPELNDFMARVERWAAEHDIWLQD